MPRAEPQGRPAGAAPLSVPRVLVVIAGLYLTQSAIGGLTFMGVPTVLRAAGVGLDGIGLLSLLMLPWALKVLWAPAVERLRLAPDGRRRSRPIALAGQGVALAALATLAFGDPATLGMRLIVTLAVVAVIIATVDIACDGFMIDHLPPASRSWGNVMQVGGGFLGMVIGGGLFLVLVDRWGWSAGIGLTVALLTILSLPMAVTREPSGKGSGQATHRPSLAYAVRRKEVRLGLMTVVLTLAGLRLTQMIIGPFLIDHGVDLGTAGMLSGGLGVAAGVVGVLGAGICVRRWGARRVLVAALYACVPLFAGFVVIAPEEGLPLPLLAGLVLGHSVLGGVLFVSLYTAMTGWSSPRQAGLDFTLFQCMDAAVAGLAGLNGGVLTEHLGYATAFGLSALLTLAGAVFVPGLVARADMESARAAAAPAQSGA